VAVDQRGDQAAIDEAGNRRVFGPGVVTGDGLVTFPEGLDLVAVFVEAAAAVAMGDVFGVMILEGEHAGGSGW